jgi:hypothetical protein
MSIVAMRSANLRKCGLDTCHGGMLPLFPSTDGTILQNPHVIPGNPATKNYYSFTTVGNFPREIMVLRTHSKPRRSLKTKGNLWCREGESIPTIFKGIVKIPPILAKCNIDAGLGAVIPVNPQARAGQFPVIWGDFGRRFTRKS